MTEKKRIRIVSNGRAGIEGDTQVFVDGVDVSDTVRRVTWRIGSNFPENMSVATVTFNDAELDVEYVAEEQSPPERTPRCRCMPTPDTSPAAGRLMQIGLGRFSSYLVDVDALMSEVNSQVTGRFVKTARWPCTIRLNPLDLDAVLKQYRLPPATPDGPARMFNVPVIRDEAQRLGEITVTQCQTSLYQPGECDCPAPSVNPA